jgi:hypothetical protein
MGEGNNRHTDGISLKSECRARNQIWHSHGYFLACVSALFVQIFSEPQQVASAIAAIIKAELECLLSALYRREELWPRFEIMRAHFVRHQ